MSAFLDSIGVDETYDLNGFEQRVEHEGMVPPGYYHATLHGAKPVVSPQQQMPGWEFVFRVSKGPFVGTEVKMNTYVDRGNSKSKDRMVLLGARLGLLKRDAAGKVARDESNRPIQVDGKDDFTDCIDTPCIIHVTHRTYDRDDGRKGTALDLSPYAVFAPNDPAALKAISDQEKGITTPPKSGAGNGTGGATNGTTRAKAETKKPEKSLDEQLANL